MPRLLPPEPGKDRAVTIKMNGKTRTTVDVFSQIVLVEFNSVQDLEELALAAVEAKYCLLQIKKGESALETP